VIHVSDGEWNPTDYALSPDAPRSRLPLWFSLAVYGLDNYREAIETAVRLARDTAQLIKATPHVELIRGAGSRCGAVPSGWLGAV
jgi:aromatic-L-amino-acid decarboxylase